ncbi:MAG: methyltransferase domain-containing protein [Planctomycetaceae bacterium]|nr:methyltransferase domain-containing protein [Planctomycetaceae bacterium]
MPARRPSRPSRKPHARQNRRRKSAPVQKPKPPEPTVRLAVLELLERYQSTGTLVRDQLKTSKLPAELLSQAAHWTERLIQRRRTIEAVLAECVKRPADQVELRLRLILLTGANELLFGPESSFHAAISETVNLCRLVGKPEWTGFVNGVLRGVQRLLTDQEQSEPGSNAYPLEEGRYRKINQDLFPDPTRHLQSYLTVAFSLPDAAIREWSKRYAPDVLWQLCWASLQGTPLHVRINRLATTVEEWLEKCAAAQLDVTRIDNSTSVRVNQKIRISELPGYESGEFVVQDLTATAAAAMLNPYPGSRVLDLCAGPGTKTTQLAELMLDRGNLIACEVSESRLNQISENCERLGLTCISPLLIDRQEPQIEGEPFDAILVDAPCSNTGVLGKRPEARWRYSIKELHELNEIQMRLLDTAARLLAPEGQLVYSTCSIEPKENEQLIERWLEQHPDFQVVDSKAMLPDGCQDGGYCVRLEMRPEDENGSDTV